MTSLVPGALTCAGLVSLLLVGGGGALHRWARLGTPNAAVAALALAAAWIVAETTVAVLFRRPSGWMAFLSVGMAFGAVHAWRRRGGPARARIPPGESPDGPVSAGSRRLLLLAAGAIALPLFWLPVPLDTDAQGFGHLALAIRDGGTLTSLAPWRPGITYLYAPGALVVFARVSSLLPWTSMADVMLGAGHAFAFVFVWSAGVAARELGSTMAGQAGRRSDDGTWHAAGILAALLSAGYWTALADAHYTSTIALALVVGWFACLLRAWRTGDISAWVMAGLLLAAVVLTHQDTALVVALGVAPLGIAAALPPCSRRSVRGLGIVAAVAAILLLPWLTSLVSLLASGVASPFPRSSSHWRQLVVYHGIAWPAVAVAGLVAWRTNRWMLALGAWLLLVVDLAAAGIVEGVAPWLVAPIVRFDFPFGLAWHGPIVPYLLLGAGAVTWMARRAGVALPRYPSPRAAATLAVAGVIAGVSVPLWVHLARGHVSWHGAFATANDVRAFAWVRDQTARNARLLNYPGDYEGLRDWEGHWVPVVAERDCVYFRKQPFFLPGSAADEAWREQREFLAFWRDPIDSAHAARLRGARVTHVVVPEVVNDPAVAVRWRGAPPALLDNVRSRPADAPYLRRVFAAGGAEVYALEEEAR